MALFRHKITLYRFNQGVHTIAGGLKWEQGAEPPPPRAPLTLTTGDGEPGYFRTMINFDLFFAKVITEQLEPEAAEGGLEWGRQNRRGSGDGSPPAGTRDGAAVGVLGTKSSEAEEFLK